MPVIDALLADGTAEMRLLVAGTHGSQGYGASDCPATVPAEIVVKLGAAVADHSEAELVGMAANCATEVARAIASWRPDLLVVLGDRYELLGVALAATVRRVPLAHLHGGETTVGAIDDGIRHALTKLSHLHFCATEEYAARVRSMGEELWRVHVTGGPGIDRLLPLVAAHTLDEVEAAVGRQIRRPFGLVTYHPPTARPEELGAELEAIVRGCEQLATVVVTAPGADPGADEVTARLKQWEEARPTAVTIVPSLGELYPIAMASADVVVGNSSSGIIEAPSLGVPVVNVGSRQEGRVRAANVVDVPGDASAVHAAIQQALVPGGRDRFRAENPHGDGHAGRRIADMLITVPLGPLLDKHFVDPR